jgi:hypothetical protein
MINFYMLYEGFYHFDEKTRTCMINRTFNRVSVTGVMVIGVQLPCILLYYFYIRIFISAAQINRRARTQLELKRSKTSYKFSVGLFASLILFTSTLIPYSIMLIVDYADKFHRVFHAYGLVLMRINSCLNPVLYYFTNPMFKKGFKNFYFLLFNRKEYSFSIVKKEKKLLNHRLHQNVIEMKKQTENLDPRPVDHLFGKA